MKHQNDPDNRKPSVFIVHQDMLKADLLANRFHKSYQIHREYTAFGALKLFDSIKKVDMLIIDNGTKPVSGIELIKLMKESGNNLAPDSAFVLLDEHPAPGIDFRAHKPSGLHNVFVYSEPFNPDSIFRYCEKIKPASFREKRHCKRIRLSEISNFSSEFNVFERTRIINLSEKGALIDHPALLSVGETVMLRLWTDNEKMIHLTGKVVRKAEFSRFGITFIDTSNHHNCSLFSLKKILLRSCAVPQTTPIRRESIG